MDSELRPHSYNWHGQDFGSLKVLACNQLSHIWWSRSIYRFTDSPQILSCSRTLFQVIRPDKCRPPSLINDIPWYSMHVVICRTDSLFNPPSGAIWANGCFHVSAAPVLQPSASMNCCDGFWAENQLTLKNQRTFISGAEKACKSLEVMHWIA